MIPIFAVLRMGGPVLKACWEFATSQVGMVILALVIGFSYGEYRCTRSEHQKELAAKLEVQQKQLEASQQALRDQKQLADELQRQRTADKEKIDAYARELEASKDSCTLSGPDTRRLRDIGNGQSPRSARPDR